MFRKVILRKKKITYYSINHLLSITVQFLDASKYSCIVGLMSLIFVILCVTVIIYSQELILKFERDLEKPLSKQLKQWIM